MKIVRQWAGRPVGIERDPASRTVYNVFVDDVFTGVVVHRGDGWRWQLGWAHNGGPAGYAEPTRERALDALLAAHTKAVDAWATP